ncbi:hypothetical protein SLS56_005317 [Neofusicoccum ribis]|uniref:Uncharacterized protein n=1 Tax=Neofusicoccum ribis TaxID=45134 RepID=A0ABR3SUE6_9PEZI
MAIPLDDSQGMVADVTLPAAGEPRHLNPSTGLPQRIDSGTAFTDDRLSKGGAGKHEPEQPSPEHILELIDSALRLTICEKPLKLPPGIKITRDNVTRLATVAPALWRPNHLKAVFERAPFIPTIAHALSHSLPTNARSTSLKRKAAELLDHHPPAASRAGPLSPEDVQHYKGPNFAYEAASIGLWNLLQRGDFGSGASGRLKRLKTRPSNVDAYAIGEHDEMLYGNSDEWQQNSDSFANGEDSANLSSSSQSQLPDDEMLWECSEYEEKDTRSPSRTPATPCGDGNLLRVFRSGDTDEDLLLDWEDSTISGYGVVSGNLLQTQDSPARPKAQVSATDDGDMEANVSFGATYPTDTLMPADAYDRLSTDPEMLFDGEFREDEDDG